MQSNDRIEPTDKFSMVEHELIKMEGMNIDHLGLYSVLKMFANENTDECFPAIPTLAKICGKSKNTIHKLLDDLKEKGIIEVVPRFVEGKKERTSNLYKIYGPWGKELYEVKKKIKIQRKEYFRKLEEGVNKKKNPAKGQGRDYSKDELSQLEKDLLGR